MIGAGLSKHEAEVRDVKLVSYSMLQAVGYSLLTFGDPLFFYLCR